MVQPQFAYKEHSLTDLRRRLDRDSGDGEFIILWGSLASSFHIQQHPIRVISRIQQARKTGLANPQGQPGVHDWILFEKISH